MFNLRYPFLKIELSVPGIEIPNGEVVFKEQNGRPAELQIAPNMTSAMLQNALQDTFNLNTHIFRRTGNSWIRIGVTSDWELQYQNKQGELTTDYL